jgi:hypothetical protein
MLKMKVCRINVNHPVYARRCSGGGWFGVESYAEMVLRLRRNPLGPGTCGSIVLGCY